MTTFARSRKRRGQPSRCVASSVLYRREYLRFSFLFLSFSFFLLPSLLFAHLPIMRGRTLRVIYGTVHAHQLLHHPQTTPHQARALLPPSASALTQSPHATIPARSLLNLQALADHYTSAGASFEIRVHWFPLPYHHNAYFTAMSDHYIGTVSLL